MGESRGRREEKWRVKLLPHLLLLLRVTCLLSCPSPSSHHPLACARPALIVRGSSATKATKATKAASTTTTRATTKTTSAATAATLWTAPPTATVTMTTTSIMEAAVTRGDQGRGGGCRPGQEGREEGGEEEEEEEGEGGTETEASTIINTSTISTITIHTSTPTMHHSSQELTPTTTACRDPGSCPLLLTCCWGRGHHRGVGASPPRPG